MSVSERREGSLEAPTRHPVNWRDATFHDEDALFRELERVFDICHGCRRCVSLCNAFPTLFDLVDQSPSMEVDGVVKADYWKVVDQCYLCDLCFMTKCPYVPPHEWNVDFPHLMLRGKAVKFRKGDTLARDKILTSTDAMGRLAGLPVIVHLVNAVNRTAPMRAVLDRTLGVHPQARIPEYHSRTLRKRLRAHQGSQARGEPVGRTKGRVTLFATCYGNYNEPHIGEDLVAVFQHNDIPVTIAGQERCCGMPKLELGDLEAVEAAKNANVQALMPLVEDGWDIVAPVPSCVLMFKQELPLIFPEDAQVQRLRAAIFDPFEYLMLRHKEGKLRTDFKNELGKVAYHVACHQRVQNLGMKTREALELVPGTEVVPIERCSGHDGTYAVKRDFFDAATKIGRPVVSKIKQINPDHYGSDCPMAGHHLANGLRDGRAPEHPISLLRKAYGI